ncbi:gliding motility-associated C-terminal domain-containing protein [Mucilaginibacter calamicampi]|uniref:Gliding motility-associated C-terminal domain-containing protein n=1 Tax=Mucilaginibacter calamicampi TaxID=1302352 RepID=A0ABW2YXJ7_9SPHI
MYKRYILTLIVVFVAVKAFAQNGLGDPVIYRNFISGNSLHGAEIPGFVGGTAPYSFSTADMPPEGSYTLINNTNTVSAWWPTLDHTPGDGNNGYMLIVKTRSVGFQVLFEQGVDNLCAGTNYEFGAFIANISRNPGAVTPRIRLRVETNTTPRVQIVPDLAIPINYSATGAVWANPIMNFSPMANGSVIVSIISETPGGASTDDLAIDDITVNAEGQKIDAAFDNGGDYRPVCADSPTSFSATATTPTSGNVIKWQRKLDDGAWVDIPGETSTKITFLSATVPGTYRYRAASASPDKIAKFSCSVVTNELTVWVKPLVTASAGSQKFYLRGGTPVMLQGSSNSGSFFWTVESGADISSLSSSTELTPFASPNQTTVYVLHASGDANTCGPDIISKVTVAVADDIMLPNTFTPNGDGINDKWVIGGINSYQNPLVQVYDRNGQLVYRSAGANTSAWDGTYKGKNVPTGNYYYIVDLNTNGIKLTGSVTVLR